MKKELIIIFGIIICIVTIHILSQRYVERYFDNIIDGVSNIENKVLKEKFDKDELEAEIDEVIGKWKDKYDLLACFLEHDELEKVDNQFVAIKANVIAEKYEESVEELEKCKFVLKNIEEKDSLKVVNIF